MWSFPTREPVILSQGSFTIERMLPQGGDVVVSEGQRVASDEVIAQSEDIEQTVTLYVASELGVESSDLSKYVSKSIGSTISSGDVIARIRRGLRTATVKAPTDGTLVAIDDASGTVILSSSLGKRDLLSLVDGEVEQVVPGRGAVIRTTGTRIYGIAGLGTEAIGPLIAGTDRPDRELTVGNISDEWAGAIVLVGMTAGAPALARLQEVGALGVILGSIPEDDVRRYTTGGQMSQAEFWNPLTAVRGDLSNSGVESPLAIIVTEGFGRKPMNGRTFEILNDSVGQSVSISARTSIGMDLIRPEIFLPNGDSEAATSGDEIFDGRAVRLVDTGAFSVAGHVSGAGYERADRYGRRQTVHDIELDAGGRRTVPVQNIEVVE